MPLAALISANEYLTTTYRPDREWLDGILLERNLGEYEHGRLHLALGLWFHKHEREWNIRVVPEQRIRVSATSYRIPDICVFSRDQPVFTTPPLICIEVLSKDDTLRGMQDRIDDYLTFGVPNIWILDPASRRAYICDRTGLHEELSGVLKVLGTPINLPLATLFAELDS